MTVCEVQNPDDPENKNEEYWYLLHWGMTAGKFVGDHGEQFASQWTIAICQNIKTGVIQTFIPDVITILGYERINERTKNWSSTGGKDK